MDKINKYNLDLTNLGPASFDIIVGSIDEVEKGVATHTIDTFASGVTNNSRIVFLNGEHVPTGNISLTQSGLTLKSESSLSYINSDTYTFVSTGNNCDIDLNVTLESNVSFNRSVDITTFKKVKNTIYREPIDYNIKSSENGIKKFENGAIFSFDDWNGWDILSGSNGFVVPYKSSLSNVFTGIEVKAFKGIGAVTRFIKPKLGLNWFKSRDSATDHRLFMLLTGSMFWESSATDAGVYDDGDNSQQSYYVDEGILLGADKEVGVSNEKYINWNWHFPCVKAYHANGGSSQKVQVPVYPYEVDSVESNADSQIGSDEIAIELYNPLTKSGVILYTGTGTARKLDHSAGDTPKFMFARDCEVVANWEVYHASINDGTDPADYLLRLDSANPYTDSANPWNDIEPTFSLISLGTAVNLNTDGDACMLFYFCDVAGLQDFGNFDGGTNPKTLTTGCKDGLIFIKMWTGAASGSWLVTDSIRGSDTALYFDVNNAEAADGGVAFDGTSGVEITGTDANTNAVGYDYIYGHFGTELIPQGNIDVYNTDSITSVSDNNSVIITFEYKGVATLNTELNVYASREATPNWVQGTIEKLDDISDGYQLLQARIDISGNASGTDMRWRFTTNESGSETQHDIKNLKFEWY